MFGLALSALAALHCGNAVAPGTEGPTGETPAAVTPAPSTLSCAEVQASCGAEPQRFVRGHAEGLVGLDGARVLFSMRYRGGYPEEQPSGVVTGAGQVRGGAFEACVCMPYGGNWYPEVAAVVFVPGSSGETGADVARAHYSQRYATLGDEDFSGSLEAEPARSLAEAALAATMDRAQTLRVRGLEASAEGRDVYATIVAPERSVGAQVVGGQVVAGAATLELTMAGRRWPGERAAIYVDRDGDHRCGEGDLGAFAAFDESGAVDGRSAAWVQGAALREVCDAMGSGSARGS